ncbi:hypothetical protein GIB67_029002 [Kingdonia uniflora]|uniref:Pentatricopeptide repeat-containing protein n=1 Tax=Kingdonia uniflora TaxID=39325 RepID=A0A7J7N6L7_9MAGN|nr:hypothetical protein GIB67_029002 [Kingdonia uniflora]
MAWISSPALKQLQWRKHRLLSLNPSSSLYYLHGFCSSTSTDPPPTSITESPSNVEEDGAIKSTEVEKIHGRVLRGTRSFKPNDKVEEIICRMMANRAWTPQLQSSIRALVPEFYNTLVLNVLDGARNAEHALQFFRWVPKTGYCHDVETHLKIIEVLGKAAKLNHARCILLDMPKKGLKWNEDMFVVLIDSYGKAGIVQESVRIFKKMKELNVPRTIKSYDALFKVILRRGRYFMAKRYFNAMLREGVLPTLHTYNTMIWGFFISLKAETATRFFEEMKSRGIIPNVITYNTMINGYCRVKQIDEAEKFFVELKESNLIPDVVSYTTMIKGYVSADRVDDGLKLFDEMSSSGIAANDVTYSTLLPGLCDAEKLPEARRILGEMVESQFAPTDNSVFLKLISCYCKSDNLDWAVDVLNGMIRLNVPTEAAHYSILIESFCNGGAYDKAVKLLDSVIEKEILLNPQSTSEMEPSAYNQIIGHLCTNGETKKAETFFRQLMKKGVQDPVAFNNLLRGHSEEGTLDSAIEIVKIMGRRGVAVDADVYKLLVECFLKKGEPADAKTTLDGMIESGHEPNSTLFREVMKSLFDDGRVQTASRVMVSMLEKGVKENMDLAAKILEALLMRGHVEEALGRIDLLMNNGCAPDFDSLLAVLCGKEKTVAAMKLLEFGLERDCSISSSSYDKVLDALAAGGKILNAYSILCKILTKRGVTNLSSREDLIKSLNAEGNTKQADTLSRMIMGGEKANIDKKGKKVAV